MSLACKSAASSWAEDHGSLRSGTASESIAATLLCLQATPAQASKPAAKAGTRSCTQPGHLQPRINADNKVSSEDKFSTVWFRSGFISSLSPSIVSAVFVTVYLSFGLLHFYSSTDRAVICYWMYRVSKRQCLVFTVASAVVSASSFSNLFFHSSFTVASLCFPYLLSSLSPHKRWSIVTQSAASGNLASPWVTSVMRVVGVCTPAYLPCRCSPRRSHRPVVSLFLCALSIWLHIGLLTPFLDHLISDWKCLKHSVVRVNFLSTELRCACSHPGHSDADGWQASCYPRYSIPHTLILWGFLYFSLSQFLCLLCFQCM